MSGDWRQAADPPEPARPGNRRAVLVLVVATSAILLVAAAATGLWSVGAYGARDGQSMEAIADARQLRGALHAVAAGAAVFALVGLALFAVLARESHEAWTRVGVGLVLLVLFGAGGFLTASGAREHLQAGKPRVVDGGDAALREAAGLAVPSSEVAGPPPDPTSFWLHLAVVPVGLIAAAAVLLGPRRS